MVSQHFPRIPLEENTMIEEEYFDCSSGSDLKENAMLEEDIVNLSPISLVIIIIY
jgi:hypothetical protein